jgi:ligand-binding sensor protein
VKSLFENQNAKFMSSCCLASYFIDQHEQEVEESLNREGFCDLSVIILV